MPLRESLDATSSLWHWIAVDLHHYRTKAGLSLADMGVILSCERSTVSSIEACRPTYKLDETQAKAIDQLWDLNRHFELLLHYAKAGHDPDWVKQYATYESRASEIRSWELAWVPGLLQTEDYARASLLSGGYQDVNQLLEARMKRQEVLSKVVLWALVSQAALEAPVGGPEVMGAQLSHLLEVSSRPGVHLRVVPREVGGHVGMDGAFEVLTVGQSDVAYAEAQMAGRLVTAASDVRSYLRRFDLIGQGALPARQSRDLIREIRVQVEESE